MSSLFHRIFFGVMIAVGLLLGAAPRMLAQTRTVDSGELSLASPADMDFEEAKAWVLKQARIRALANEFGTRVRSESVYSVTDANGEVDDAFTELSVSQVKGEWVRTLEEIGPEPFVKDGGFWWTVRVRGQARPIKESRVELELTLVEDREARVSVEAVMAEARIRCGFISPVDGYLLLFYLEKGTVYALAEDPKVWSVPVEGQTAYSLFTAGHEWRKAGLEGREMPTLKGYDHSLKATNDGDVDLSGMLIAAFSTERFSPPIAEGNEDISTLREDDFERWVKRKSGASDAFQLERQPVRIRAKKKME